MALKVYKPLIFSILYYNLLVFFLLFSPTGFIPFPPLTFSGINYIIGFFLISFPVLPLLAIGNRLVSSTFIFILFQLAFILIPASSLFSVVPSLHLPPLLLVFMSIFLFSLGILVRSHQYSNFRFTFPLPITLLFSSPLLILVIIALFTLVSVYWLGISSSIQALFDFKSLYSHRASVYLTLRSIQLASLSLIAYFVSPTLAIYAVVFQRGIKKLLILFSSLFISLCVFQVTGMKAHLVIVPFTFIIFLLAYRKTLRHFTNSFFGLLIFSSLFGFLLSSLTSNPWPHAFIFQRTLITPGTLHLLYDHYAHTQASQLQIFTGFNSYGLNPAAEIAQLIYNHDASTGATANTGVFASALVSHGYIGLVLSSLFIFLLLLFLDSRSTFTNTHFLCMMTIPSLFCLVNSDLINTSLYYGFFGCISIALLVRFKFKV